MMARRPRLFASLCACAALALFTVLLVLQSLHVLNTHRESQDIIPSSDLTHTHTYTQHQSPHPHTIPIDVAFVFAGSARSFVCPRVHWSIKHFLVDGLQAKPHVFVRIATQDNINIRTGEGRVQEPSPGVSADLEAALNILEPRKVQWVRFGKEEEAEMIATYPGKRHSIFREHDRRRYSMFFHRSMAYRMVLEYEEQHNMRFDWVVHARLDMAWANPPLPIHAYSADRAWATETGVFPYNDQFMLIPRVFSDAIYDLDQRVSPRVYCLGGPDMERWKCNAAELALRGYDKEKSKELLQACCSDFGTATGHNTMGLSENILYEHLHSASIPVGVATFPTTIVRFVQSGKTEFERCRHECWRLHTQIYYQHHELRSPPQWPDTRGRMVSFSQFLGCVMMHAGGIWNPAPAIDVYRGSASVSVPHPEMFMAWRIHSLPMPGDGPGCLRFNRQLHSYSLDSCIAISRPVRTKRYQHEGEQLFFLTVRKHDTASMLHAQQSNLSNTNHLETLTQVVSVFGDFTTKCLTLDKFKTDAKPRSTLCVPMPPAISGSILPMNELATLVQSLPVQIRSQLFISPRGLMAGSFPESTIGRLHVAGDPSLCLGISGWGYNHTDLKLTSCQSQARRSFVDFERIHF